MRAICFYPYAYFCLQLQHLSLPKNLYDNFYKLYKFFINPSILRVGGFKMKNIILEAKSVSKK